MQARSDEIATLVAAQPGIAACLPASLVRASFAEAAAKSQPAWSLLFYALWHSHHVIGIPADGDIAATLADAGRAG